MLLPQVSGYKVRPVQLDDAAAWASYSCLPEVKIHTSSAVSTVADVEAMIERILASAPSLPMRFVLQQTGSSAVQATVGFHTVSSLNGTAEISYDVAPAYWGRGIATAACRAATIWAFEVAGWHRVQATTLLPNVASQRVLEKCGFKLEGLVRNFRVVAGRPADYWLYSAIPGEVRSEA